MSFVHLVVTKQIKYRELGWAVARACCRQLSWQAKSHVLQSSCITCNLTPPTPQQSLSPSVHGDTRHRLLRKVATKKEAVDATEGAMVQARLSPFSFLRSPNVHPAPKSIDSIRDESIDDASIKQSRRP